MCALFPKSNYRDEGPIETVYVQSLGWCLNNRAFENAQESKEKIDQIFSSAGFWNCLQEIVPSEIFRW